MRLSKLWLRDFRCYEELDIEFARGCTVVTGSNGQGKTSLLEAVSWIATARSLRGVVDAALVRSGAEEAIVRAEILYATDNTTLVEAAIRAVGRNKILVNKQTLTRKRDLIENLRVTVFSPDDLDLVKGSPARRRDYLDDLLEASAPRYAGVRSDVERIVKQRNALLRSGVRGESDRNTLEVLDDRLIENGGEQVRGRLRLIDRLTPELDGAYASLAGGETGVGNRYVPGWSESDIALTPDDVEARMRAGLKVLRSREIDRGVSLVGPHRDDWLLELDGLDARNHGSQGEQRTLALAMRLAGHRVVAEVVGADPVLLLDDVFSELDPQRSEALIANLPNTQTLLTTASPLPPGVRVDAHLRVERGRVIAV